MVRIRLVNTIFNRVKKTPLVFSLLISFISLFLIYSHVLEMILMLGFGGIAFLLLEFLLWPILFLISPGMIITKLILPRLDNFLRNLFYRDLIIFYIQSVSKRLLMTMEC